MKFTKYFMPLAAVALLASCSNDNLDAPGVDNNQPTGGDAYMALSIAMPATTDTKSFSFVDGEDYEYEVHNGTVVIFKVDPTQNPATPESGYSYVCQGTLDTHAWGSDDQKQITSTSKTAVATFNANSIDKTDDNDYYALVILNKNSILSSYLGLNAASATGTSFGAWQKDIQEALTSDEALLGNETNGFTMTNAPLLKMQDGEEEESEPIYTVTTLVKIDKSKVGTNSTNLESAADIYVQRVAAKVTVSASKDWEYFTVEKPAGGTLTGDYVDFKAEDNSGWGLDFTNKTTFPVQVADNYSNWVGTGDHNSAIAGKVPGWFHASAALKKADGKSSGLRRIFWGVDPNYDGTGSFYTNGFFRLDKKDDEGNIIGNEFTTNFDAAAYCLENTMNYDHMIQNETTTAIFKGVYHLNGDEDAVSFISVGTWRQAVDDDTLDDLGLEFKNEDQESVAETKVTDLFKLNASKKEELELEDGADETPYVLAAFDLQQDVEVNLYIDGVVYYRARINHFDPQEETPRPVNFTTVNDYSSDEIGRFGVLRNNWYVVNLNKINGVGDPVIPEDPNIPDDDPDKQYMEVSIHILAWAKRAYDYDF